MNPMRITYQPDKDGREAYIVEADTGQTYHVRLPAHGDGDPECLTLWECDCPAGRRGRMCKHLRAVAALADDDPLLPAGTVLRDDKAKP